MKEINMSTENDEQNASLLMAVTFTLTGEFYDWIHASAQPAERMTVMTKFPRPGDLFMHVIGPWAIEIVAEKGTSINDRQIAEVFAKEFQTRLFGEATKTDNPTGGIGAEVGAPGVKQGPPPTPQIITEDAG